MRNEMG
jgi:hypothetical protein